MAITCYDLDYIVGMEGSLLCAYKWKASVLQK